MKFVGGRVLFFDKNNQQMQPQQFQNCFEDNQSPRQSIECCSSRMIEDGFHSLRSEGQGVKIKAMIKDDEVIYVTAKMSDGKWFYSSPKSWEQKVIKRHLERLIHQENWKHEHKRLSAESGHEPHLCLYCLSVSPDDECPDCEDSIDTIQGTISK